MFSKCKRLIRNILKMVAQNFILSIAYTIARIKHPEPKTLYIFADAHHTKLPFSLEAMYNHVVSLGIVPACHFYDYTHEGSIKSLIHAISFMDLYAQAKYVFICDTFLPVSSGRKPKGTRVVQLCHYSGPLKKIGYATPDDIPTYYKGNVFKNYDLVTASSEVFVPLLTSAMRQTKGIVQALGVSRSDVFFDPNWMSGCKEDFYTYFPNARSKKVLLWAPTFRGKAGSPNSLDNESFLQLQNQLGEDWLVLIKHHPHDDAVAVDPRYRSNCSIPSERLLPVVDLLITDYSTTVLDYILLAKPFILYAPDITEYEEKRGFFIDYRALTKNLITDARQLDKTILSVYQQWLDGNHEDILYCKKTLLSACDGKSTPRIFNYIHNME